MNEKKPRKKEIKSGERSKLINSGVDTCYKPECSRPLFVFTDGHWLNNFDIAHIRDELEPAPNDSHIGHRYYPAPKTDKEREARNQYENLILLCRSCHNLIDKVAPRDYTVRLLHDWKQEAESNELRTILRATFGDKLLTEQDWADALLDGSIIHNAHKSSEKEWESLDRRFTVKSSYIDGNRIMAVGAKNEPVPLTWKFSGGHGEKMDGLIKRAQPFSVPSSQLSISGSDLFTEILQREGVMMLLPQGKPATVKLSMSSFRIDDIVGTIKTGSEMVVFDGTCYGGVFTLHIEFLIPTGGSDENGIEGGKFSFNFDLSKWNGVDIRELPYFQKVNALMDAIEENSNIAGVVEYYGDKLLEFGIGIDEFDVVNWGAYQYVLFANTARKIATYFGEAVEFHDEFEFSEKEHLIAYDLVKFIRFVENPELFSKEFKATTTHVADKTLFEPGTVANRAITGEPLDIANLEPAVDIQLFDRTLSIPKRGSLIGNVAPRVIGEQPTVGERYQVEWLKTEQTVARFYFEDENNPIPNLPSREN